MNSVVEPQKGAAVLSDYIPVHGMPFKVNGECVRSL